MSPYCWHKLECGSNVKKKGEKAEEEEEEFKKKGEISRSTGIEMGQRGGGGGWRFDLRERDCPCS